MSFGSGLSFSVAIEVVTAYTRAKLGGNKLDKIGLAIIPPKEEKTTAG